MFTRIFKDYIWIEDQKGKKHYITKEEWVNFTQEEREKYIYIGKSKTFLEHLIGVFSFYK